MKIQTIILTMEDGTEASYIGLYQLPDDNTAVIEIEVSQGEEIEDPENLFTKHFRRH